MTEVSSPAALLGLFLASASPLSIGSAAPDFSVVPLQGSPFSFEEAARTRSAVVLVFMSVVCPYSNLGEEHLRELAARHGEQVLFVGVDSNRTETAEELAEHARKKGLTFPLMKDAGNKLADLIGARVTPEAFVFDHDRILRYRGRVRSKIGSTDLKDALEAVLAGRPVRTPVAKAFGCAIVRD
jgi:peroxiredoxin